MEDILKDIMENLKKKDKLYSPTLIDGSVFLPE